MLQQLDLADGIDAGTPMRLVRMSCRGNVVQLALEPTGAHAHPSGRGREQCLVRVQARLVGDAAPTISLLRLWRDHQVVVRVASDGTTGVSLWHGAGRRVQLAVQEC